MNAQIRITTFLLIMLSSLSLAAQDLILFQENNSKAYLVKFGSSGSSRSMTDHFITQIAKGNQKKINQTEYVLVHDEFIRLTRKNASTLEAFVTLKDMRVTGDTRYRDMNLGNALFPAAVKFTLEQRGPNGQLQNTWDFDAVTLDGNPMIIASFEFQDSVSIANGGRLIVKNKQFIYRKANRSQFDDRILLIDDYYTVIPALESIYAELQQINPQDLDGLADQETRLQGVKAEIEAIRVRQYVELLGLNQNFDPAGFIPKFREVHEYGNLKERELQDARRNLPRLYYERGMAEMQANRAQQALVNFEKAMNLDATFAPAYLGIAHLDYRAGELVKAKDGLLYIFRDLQPDEITANEARQLARTMEQQHLGNADYAVRQSRFEDALVDIDFAAALCNEIPAMNCGPELDALARRAHDGIFRRMVSAGRQQLNSGQYSAAAQQAKASLDYATEYKAFIPDARPAQLLLNEAQVGMYSGMLTDTRNLINKGEVDKAESQIRAALDFAAQNPQAITDNQEGVALLDQVMGIQYGRHIKAGKELAMQNQYRDALNRYDTAFDLEQQHQFQRNPELTGLRSAAAKVVWLLDADTALDYAKNNQLGEARKMQTRLIDMRDKYGLATDGDVKVKFESLSGAIFDQQCQNTQQKYDRHLADADRLTAAGKYIEAMGALDAALQAARDDNQCGLDVSSATKGKTAIQPAVTYLEKMQHADKAVEHADYRKAVNMHGEAGTYFQQNDLGTRFQLHHKNLFDYIEGSGRREFSRYGAKHFGEQKEFEKAITLMRRLLDRGYKKGYLKVIMTDVGRAMAIEDHQAIRAAIPSRKPSHIRVVTRD